MQNAKKRRIMPLAMGFLLVVVLVASAACGSTQDLGQNFSPNLVGTWAWIGTDYYVLNNDGTGTMDGTPINWGSDNGVLLVCVTPSMCRNRRCTAPMEWLYSVDGDQLTLTSRQDEGMSYVYNRR